MPIRELSTSAPRDMMPARAGRPARSRRPGRWRPHLEALEQFVLLNASDLVVSSAIAPTILAQSETAEVGWTVSNRGTDSADAARSDAVYLSTDDVLDAADTLLASSPPAA